MMDYEMFKQLIREKLPEYLPKKLRGAELEFVKTRKINRSCDSLVVHLPDGSSANPTFHVDHIYESYQRGRDFTLILEEMAEIVEETLDKTKDAVISVNPEELKEHVVMALINTEQNREYLKDLPHREFQDLSVVFRWITDMDKSSVQSVLITNQIACKVKMSEDELFRAAVENTKKIFQPKVTELWENLQILKMQADYNQEMKEVFQSLFEEEPPEEKIWVITNEQGIHGAVSMLYENVLHDLAEKLGADLYLLPSSIHEVLAVSAKMWEPEKLADMVKEVNMEAVIPEERLSNNVYHYDKERRKIRMATDVPDRRLDGENARQTNLVEKNSPERKR